MIWPSLYDWRGGEWRAEREARRRRWREIGGAVAMTAVVVALVVLMAVA